MKYEEARTARAWREVDLEAVAHNAAWLQGRIGPGCRLMAVVKADAYGHGAGPVARCLEEQGVKAFAVACLSEGIALRRQGVRGLVLILGYTPPEEATELARWGLTQCVADEAHGRALSAAGVPLEVHLALDTGMHRLGIPAEDHEAIARTRALPNLKFTGTFSHLCVSDGASPEDLAFTQAQLDRFYGAVARMAAAGLDPGAVHIQASYGILNLPHQPCAWARAGIALYGYLPDPSCQGLDAGELWPVMTLKTRVAAVRELPGDTPVSYGCTQHMPASGGRVAVLPVGYADGLHRVLSGQGTVLVGGQERPIVGRVCMDMCMVALQEGDQVQPGDEVELFGAHHSLEDMAQLAGTIPYELLCAVSPRVPRLYQGA